MMKPDKTTIETVKQGDRDRFAELLERHKRRVYAIAWSYLGDAQLREDAAQESFIPAFRYLRALRNPERFVGGPAKPSKTFSAVPGGTQRPCASANPRDGPRWVRPADLHDGAE